MRVGTSYGRAGTARLKTGMRTGTGRMGTARMGTARMGTGRLGTGAMGDGMGGALNTQVKVGERPMTQHGLGGTRPKTQGSCGAVMSARLSRRLSLPRLKCTVVQLLVVSSCALVLCFLFEVLGLVFVPSSSFCYCCGCGWKRLLMLVMFCAICVSAPPFPCPRLIFHPGPGRMVMDESYFLGALRYDVMKRWCWKVVLEGGQRRGKEGTQGGWWVVWRKGGNASACPHVNVQLQMFQTTCAFFHQHIPPLLRLFATAALVAQGRNRLS